MILKSLFTLFFLFNLTNGEYSQVLLWDSLSPSVPILEKISRTNFMEYIVSDDIYKSMLITFIDDQVEFNDLSKCKLNAGIKCYNYLSQVKNKVFYLNVEEPIDVLRNLNLKKEYVEINENNDINTPIKYEKSKIVFIKFSEKYDNNDKNKAMILSKRDSAIKEIYQKLSEKGKTIGLLIGKQQHTLKRLTRQATSNDQKKTDKGHAFNIESQFLIYYKNLSSSGSDGTKELAITTGEIKNKTKSGFDVELIDEKRKIIKFHVDMEHGYWYLNDAQYDNKSLKIDSFINAAEKFSYYCGNVRMNNNEQNVTLTWHNLQVQPNFNLTQQNFQFNDPWHCVGFTSIGIWSGLFVTFLMLAILSIGITWLMDIRTMDRFDDPKGKTITVSASD